MAAAPGRPGQRSDRLGGALIRAGQRPEHRLSFAGKDGATPADRAKPKILDVSLRKADPPEESFFEGLQRQGSNLALQVLPETPLPIRNSVCRPLTVEY